MKQAVIYARVSSQGDRQDTSRQVVDLRKAAERKGLEVVKVFECHISGAKKRDEQPVLNECLSFCYDNGIDMLMVSELSRLSRNIDTLQQTIIEAKEKHLNIYFQKEELSIFMPDGKVHPCLAIMVAVLGTCAQMERENIYYRLNSGRQKYISDGGKLGRKVGYRKSDDAILEQYPEVVKELKKAKPLPLRKLAKWCDVSVNTVSKVKQILIENGTIKGTSKQG